MLHLKRMVYATLLSLTLVSPISYAEQYYQTEITAAYEKKDADTSTEKTKLLGAEIYFTPVNTENKPLAQASFLDKKSSVFAGYMNSKSDLQNSSIDSIKLGSPLIGVNYITEADAFILGAIYQKLDGDTNPNLVKIDGKILGFTIGKYINDSTTVQASYENSELELKDISSNPMSTLDIDFYRLAYNTVQMLGATNYYSFGVEFSLTRKDELNSARKDNNELNVSGGYYFTRMTSLDLAASFNSGDDISDEGRTLAIGLSHFIAPQIAIGLKLSKFNADDSNTEDTDSILIAVIARM